MGNLKAQGRQQRKSKIAPSLKAEVSASSPTFANYEFTQLPDFSCSFHAATCTEMLSLSITSSPGTLAFHSLLTDCTLPADALPYMLRSSQPTCDTFIRETWRSFLNHHNI